MAVSVSTSPSFLVGSTTPLFETIGTQGGRWEPYPQYDVSPDGKRFILAEPVGDPEASEPSIHVVENWFTEFQDPRGGAR